VHTDPELLLAQGTSGLAAARTLAGHGVQRMAGLAERLSAPTASFLDVGAGVGVIAIEMCRAYPSLRVVGLEPAEAPRRQALDRIAAAGFSDRIEIRGQGVEALTDVEEFDFAYLPQVFLSEDAFLQSLTTVLRALRRGGWAALPVISVTGDDLGAALARLRNTLWGGGAPTRGGGRGVDRGRVHSSAGPFCRQHQARHLREAARVTTIGCCHRRSP
jgi:hypothetical protein